jgi:hypothetical protein
MLSHLFADAVEEEGGAGGKGGGGKKKGGGSMQTISATHRVRFFSSLISMSNRKIDSLGTIEQIDDQFETNTSSFCSLYYSE